MQSFLWEIWLNEGIATSMAQIADMTPLPFLLTIYGMVVHKNVSGLADGSPEAMTVSIQTKTTAVMMSC